MKISFYKLKKDKKTDTKISMSYLDSDEIDTRLPSEQTFFNKK